MDLEIPPSYEDCSPGGLPPPYPKKPWVLVRFLSWIWSKVSRDNGENQRPPKYMMEITDIYGVVHYIDPDSQWEVVDDVVSD